ncbi:16125_t:CDS:2, partial [Entrophospora sp. SA101]
MLVDMLIFFSFYESTALTKEYVTDHFDEFSPESGSNQIDLTQGLDYDLKQLVLNIMNEVNNIYYDSQNGDNDLNYEDFEENNFERNNLEENDFG